MNVLTTLDGIKTHFGIFGTGPEIALIHGFGPSVSASWSLNIESLSKSCQVIVLDLPGFGESERPLEEFSINYLSKFLNHFLYSLGVERAAVVGHSLGANVAVRFAIDHPDRVCALVLAAGFGPPTLRTRIRILASPFTDRLLRTTSEKAMKRFLGSLFYDKQLVAEEIVREFHKEAEIQGTTNPRSQFWSLLNYRFSDSDLARITAPTLIMHGADDQLIPAAHSVRASTFITASELRIFQTCGHWIQREAPERFNQMISSFLEKHLR